MKSVETIVAIDLFHVYSSLEEFNALFKEIKDAVAERAKVVFAPFPGSVCLVPDGIRQNGRG